MNTDFGAGPGTGDDGSQGQKYETIPMPVEAFRQRLVSATVMLGECAAKTACPGDWIVRWPDRSLDVYTNEEFGRKFRHSGVSDVSEEALPFLKGFSAGIIKSICVVAIPGVPRSFKVRGLFGDIEVNLRGDCEWVVTMCDGKVLRYGHEEFLKHFGLVEKQPRRDDGDRAAGA